MQLLNRILLPCTCLFLLLMSGCGSDATPKASLFEHDHEVAAHWPTDLADVAVKLRQRVSMPDVTSETMVEIEDLVSWTAEVAADTNLSEQDWMPLYRATESLSSNLRSAVGTLSDDNRKQLESLCVLIEQASQKIPDQLPAFPRNAT